MRPGSRLAVELAAKRKLRVINDFESQEKAQELSNEFFAASSERVGISAHIRRAWLYKLHSAEVLDQHARHRRPLDGLKTGSHRGG